jgi:hypothetical protein
MRKMAKSDEDKALEVDHQKARDHIDRFMRAVDRGFNVRHAILTGAIQEYNDFRKLESSPSLAPAIWDLAFKGLSELVPVLRLGAIFAQQYERADLALKLAKGLGEKARLADKAKMVVTGAGLVGAKVAKYANEAKEILEKAEKVNAEPNGGVKVHASWGLIKTLINDLYDGAKLADKVLNLETEEWENRLYGREATTLKQLAQKQLTLQQLVQKHLPMPDLELENEKIQEEVKLAVLYQLVLAHCKEEVYWEVVLYPHFKTMDLKGINDSQINQIIEWFGGLTNRGKYFKAPPVFRIEMFLMWSVPEKRRLVGGTFVR